ncbi:hypothetical protein C4G54_RS01245 [Vibrio parahaemolyticus]|nr:hypothetical protein [Vibrio parahaemolyticus]
MQEADFIEKLSLTHSISESVRNERVFNADYYVMSSKEAESIVEKYKKENDLASLYEIAKEMVRKNPNKVYSWVLYILTIDAYISTDDAIIECKTAFKKRGLRKPNLWVLYLELNQKILTSEEMLEVYNEVVSNIVNDKVLLMFIEFLYDSKRFELAEVWCLKFINEKYSGSHLPYYKLIDIYIEQGRLIEAKGICEDLIEKNESNSDAWKYFVQVEKLLLSSELSDNISEKIVRCIDFAPEHYSAGMAILQNFCRLLKSKYNEHSVGVTIKQEDYKVTMIIDPPNGEVEQVEEYLTNYGLVVMGKMQPEEIVSNQFELLELKTELKLANARLELSKEHQAFLCANYETRINSLESDIEFLKCQISTSLSSHNLQLSSVIELLKDKDSVICSLSDKLSKAIDNNDEVEAKRIINEINSIKPDSVSNIKSFLFNASSGITGNIPAWIEFLNKILP